MSLEQPDNREHPPTEAASRTETHDRQTIADAFARAEKAEAQLETYKKQSGEVFKQTKRLMERAEKAERELARWERGGAWGELRKTHEAERERDEWKDEHWKRHHELQTCKKLGAKVERERDEAVALGQGYYDRLDIAQQQIERVKALVKQAEDKDDWVSADELEAVLGG